MSTINTKGNGKQSTVKVYCTESGNTVVAELIRIEKDKITVILPGFQKLILNKTTKPNFYIANMFGLEFTCNTRDK